MEYEIISRKEAKARRLKFYFTGKPCKNGGIGRRLVSTGACRCDICLEKTREYDTLRYEGRRDKVAEYKRSYRDENRVRIAEYQQRYYEDHRDKFALYRKDNPDKFRDKSRHWREMNPEKVKARNSKRRAYQIQAVTSGFSEWDEFVIQEAYDLTRQRDTETGVNWHVDHMIPLRAKQACGLHCAANIQIIPAKMNLEKRNRMVLTEPLEWLR